MGTDREEGEESAATLHFARPSVGLLVRLKLELDIVQPPEFIYNNSNNNIILVVILILIKVIIT